MNRILVPLDGSVFAEQALPAAVSLARLHGAALELLLVNESLPSGGLEGWTWAISTVRRHIDYIESRAKELGDTTGCIVEHAVAEGRTAHEICRHAAEQQPDLIVMVSRGHTGFARVLGGSVADAVIRHAGIPVLLVRRPLPGRHIRKPALRVERILIGIDGSAASLVALEAATALANRGVTELHLLEVVAPVPPLAPTIVRHLARVDRVATQAAVDRVYERLVVLADRIAARTGCDVFPHTIVDEQPARGILRMARGFSASVIAMGTHGRGTSRMFLGSVIERVLGDGRYPVLIVYPVDAIAPPLAPTTAEMCTQHQDP